MTFSRKLLVSWNNYTSMVQKVFWKTLDNLKEGSANITNPIQLSLVWLSLPTVFGTKQGHWIKRPGPSCSKLTTSLVNDSLKLTSSVTQISWNFLHIFSAKNIRILYIEFAKVVNEMTLNELVKLTTLWTTGLWN